MVCHPVITFFLDLSSDSAFVTKVGNLNNLDVNQQLNYGVTGLSPISSYYYRVSNTFVGFAGNPARVKSLCHRSKSLTAKTKAHRE